MRENSRKTLQIIRDILKWEGAQESGSLAEKLGLTPMGVRKHLYAMQEEKLVTYIEEPRPMGRPVKMWSLTPDAEKFYLIPEEMFNEVLGELKANGLLEKFQSRAHSLVENATDGWGHFDTLCDYYTEYYGAFIR